jgi:LysM repeat protein
MEFLLKPGSSIAPQAWFSIKNKILFLIWVFLMLSLTSCNLGNYYVSALDLTATAVFATALDDATTTFYATQSPPPIAEPTPIPLVPTPDIEIPTPTELSIPILESDPLPTATRDNEERPPILYYSQSGDTLPVIAARFGVQIEEIKTQVEISPRELIKPQTLLVIPDYYGFDIASDPVLPDSEIIYSPSALDFDITAFVSEAGGYLSSYREYTVDGWKSGAEIIQKVAIEESINPRILLGLLEFQSGWVYGQPKNVFEKDYPMGFPIIDKKGLLKQLSFSVKILANGYYGWREGRITEVVFKDGTQQRIHPKVNAGSAALEHFFSNFYDPARWLSVLYGEGSFPALYEQMFGSPWIRALTVEPLYSTGLTQPNMELPFLPGKIWAHTGGPHPAWGSHGAWAALDFAPASDKSGCTVSYDWVVASAPGLVVRTGPGLVVLDLDGDGYEQTGWVILYLHIASDGKVEKGTYLDQDALIGHPSCEGGSATGTHVHMVRKYNGEWIAADGPLAFNLSGWISSKGEKPYEGKLIRKDAVVIARIYGSSESVVTR